MRITAVEWIELLKMERHPEGGFFREVYRSDEVVAAGALPERFEGAHCFSTAIYFLLEQGEFSAFHRIRQDEVWHFYDGGALSLHMLGPEGDYSCVGLGCDPKVGLLPQVVVPAGTYFAAEVRMGGAFTLVGCTVSPGFEFADFEMPAREELVEQYPQHRDLIERLTCK